MSLLPEHIGFIVDGNRRWAKNQGKSSRHGHLAGYEKVKEVAIETLGRGVKYASFYVFSTENWKRSKEEVGYLMDLVTRMFEKDIDVFVEQNIRLRVIGSRERLSRSVVKAIESAETKTRDMTGGEVVLCFNYGGQLEIVDACKKIVQAGTRVAEITPELIETHLYAPDIPPCDLIVRTSGEQRLSNFMLWRAAYSELLFLDKHWPDMTKDDVGSILDEYARRGRRFGG